MTEDGEESWIWQTMRPPYEARIGASQKRPTDLTY